MKMVLESLALANDEKVQCDVTPQLSARFDSLKAVVTGTLCVCYLQERRIKDLEETLTKCKNVQEQVKGQTPVLLFIYYINNESKFGDFS